VSDPTFKSRTVVRVKKKKPLSEVSYSRPKTDPLVEILNGVPPSEVWSEIHALQEDHDECPGQPVLKAVLAVASKRVGYYMCSVCSRLERKSR
jgi:hypothetical protein